MSVLFCSVFLGIQLLSSELKRSGDDQKEDKGGGYLDNDTLTMVQGVVNDISDSCSLSVGILNNLLLVDRIEEGYLYLDLRPENARDLLKSCVQNFEVQVL